MFINQFGKWSKKGRTIVGILLSTVLATSMTACGTSSTNTASSGSSTAGDVIKVGEIGPFSGTLASLGIWDNQGVQVAVDEVNAKGGIHGKKIEIVKIDDQGNPTVAVNAANKLVNEKVVAAIATPTSTSTLAILNIFNQAEIPHFTAGQDPNLTKKGSKYIFRDTSSSETFNKTLVDYIVKKKGFTKIAIITNTGAYGKGERETFIKFLKEHNLTPVSDQVVAPEAKDFSAQLTSIKVTNPEAIFIGTEEIEMGLIAKQARALGITAQLVGGNSMPTQLFIDTAGKDVAEGAIFASTYISNELNEETKAFAAAYKQKFGEEPDSHGAKAYDGMRMLIEAMNKAYPNIDGPHIRDALLQINFHGLTGDFKFAENGEGLDKVQVGIIKNGKAGLLE
ncbi:ABC transporter substrate-binding protein [Aneurinibacillus terranovensis]|uniref:ABC transporter substrate-binding protein n=1 Tax=Aneurinibacillus terranovensis TaxID=278991 RepID=UPI00040902CF|nr:ABC transporter substrate-binding protein [Aneurinibacillus terranovensis]